ncbi:MAG: transglutaminase-like domain-containing protein [Fibrobacterota bacterium]|nr:transglutaminase-like domain-containing protein [Fibrobacterota bacterium]
MFDFIVLAQSKMAGLVDTARSREKVLQEKSAGKWAYAKVSSNLVFTRPFLGNDSIHSVQAAHLFLSARGWLITELEELEGPESLVSLKTGVPEGIDGEKGKEGPAGPPTLFPVSTKAPGTSGEADRLRYRLRLKNGGALAGALPLGPGQSLVRAVSASEWILENRKPTVIKSGPAALPPDSQRVYLASNAFLVLKDTLLAGIAGKIAPENTDPRQVVQAVYEWVTGSFRFQLGAVLFGTSSHIVRDLTGDCSEAAVLTAALLRSRGIPSRIALGYASLGKGVFIGHAWCEAWLDGGWVGVDAALREFPTGVERVKLAELDGRFDMRIAAVNLMMRTLSNLDIEIEGAWKNGKRLPLLRFPGNSRDAEKFFQDILDGMGKSKIEN